MRHGIGRRVGDPGLELLEVIGDRRGFLARPQPSQRLDLQREPAARSVGAEDRCGRPSRRPGQVLGPDQGMSPFM
jgi:hypothetical protein